MQLRNAYRILKDRIDVRRRLRQRPRLTPDEFLFSSHKTLFRDDWERRERQFVTKILPSTDLFINFGANHGYYCCLALKHNVPTMAFEPVPENCSMIIKNIKANGWGSGFSLFPVAVSNVTGLAEIHGLSRTTTSLISGFSTTSDLKSQVVPVHRIEDLIPSHVFRGKRILILMDIEGSEAHALEGAASLLNSRPSPTWIVEIFTRSESDRQNPALRAFEIMFDAGYSAYEFQGHTGVTRITQESLSDTQDHKRQKPFSGGNVLFGRGDSLEQLI